jgi:LPPG:FO 2-phospho-L-lactate transferase
MIISPQPRFLAISGGVGGAKLLLGLDSLLPPGDLTAIVNTGDDFEHMGLYICPDIDTSLYTLAGLAHPEQGWGRRDESWSFMQVLRELGGADWFNLGDRDLAVHIVRSERLRHGDTLTAIIADLSGRFGLRTQILPMCNQPVRTMIDTAEGEIGFQDYFVRLHCAPPVRSIRFAGAETATADAALAAFGSDRLEAIFICPSNPYLSIDPILAVPGIRQALLNRRVPVIAVSPLIGSRAVKGPTAKIMTELGTKISNAAVAMHYEGLIDGLIIDEEDAHLSAEMELASRATRTLMHTLDDKRRVARAILEFARAQS